MLVWYRIETSIQKGILTEVDYIWMVFVYLFLLGTLGIF